MSARKDAIASPEELKNLPDLPGLESVETTDSSMGTILLAYAASLLPGIAFAVWGCIRLRTFLDTRGLVILAVVVLLLAWLTIRLLSGFYHYRTDGGGVTMRGLFRRRFVPWTEIETASLHLTATLESTVALDVHGRRICLTPRGMGMGRVSGDRITASIWQHLRQIQRADRMALPKSALGFWDPIPDDIPQEVDWGKLPTKRARVGAIASVAIMALFAILPWWAMHENVPRMAIAAAMTLTFAILIRSFVLPEATRRAYLVRVRDGYLEAETAFSKVYIPWSDVTLSQWTRNYLRIRFGGSGEELWIPYLPGSKESENLLLAVIRKLRTAGTPQAMPLPVRVRENRAQLADAEYPESQGRRRG